EVRRQRMVGSPWAMAGAAMVAPAAVAAPASAPLVRKPRRLNSFGMFPPLPGLLRPFGAMGPGPFGCGCGNDPIAGGLATVNSHCGLGGVASDGTPKLGGGAPNVGAVDAPKAGGWSPKEGGWGAPNGAAGVPNGFSPPAPGIGTLIWMVAGSTTICP